MLYFEHRIQETKREILDNIKGDFVMSEVKLPEKMLGMKLYSGSVVKT